MIFCSQWTEFLAKKPVRGVNHPDDNVALAEARGTIGDYKLKSDVTYKANQEQRETTLKKYKELLWGRVKQYNIRYDFNVQVYNLRAEKQEIRAELDELKLQLEEIHNEIPVDQRKDAPAVRPSNETEFPENKFLITVEMKVEDATPVSKRSQMVIVVSPPADLDHHEKQVLSKKGTKFDGKDPGDLSLRDFEDLCGFSKNEKKDTPWESNLREKRLERKLFEQDDVIDMMMKKITYFDTKVQKLSSQRFQVDVDAKTMDVFMVTLHQELLILNEFEAKEDILQSKVNNKHTEVLDMKDIIEEINGQILELNGDNDRGQDRIKVIQTTFTQAVQDNKFYDFLRKVFRKKYKPPKIRKDDESSSSSSSSSTSTTSEDEDEGKSIDSRDFGFIKQDLNVCPKGCDQAIYDYTVKQRAQRHQIEIQIKEALKVIEVLKKDLEIQNKKVKLLEKDLQVCQDELEMHQREKQRKLNDVRCTVVLHLHQLQHLTPDNKASNIMDTLVFSAKCLTHLYKRVDELQVETEKLIKRHRNNIKHYTRMRSDCRYMTKRIKGLQEVITDHMKSKFGKIVDINEIEEAMLKRTFGKDDLHDLEEVLLKKIVHDLRLSMMDIKSMYINDLNFWSAEIVRVQKELTYALRYNTSQQELMTSLVKEKTELAQNLLSQGKKKQHLEGVADVVRRYGEENTKLEAVVEEQCRQMQELKEEIKLLKTKGMVLKAKEIRKEVVEEEETRMWEQLLGEEVEEEEQRKPFSTEIIIPTTLDEKSQDVATALLNEMLSALDIHLTKRSNENFIRGILSSVMRGISMTELVEELIRNLPIEPDDEQRGIVETTAEQLYVVGEPETHEEDADYCRELMEDIVDEILLAKGDPKDVMARMISNLIDVLPVDFLTEKSSIEYLVERILKSRLQVSLHASDVAHMLVTEDARRILDEIVHKVFDTGVDLLYYIKDN
ncbi:hypothetical protein Zmor_009527 [Zophobas morio]|uniref:Uncharacterized protein n=2 Tax=Zophobas morio TaxID=2755281 RepID=A0AA38MIY5_9CUCU|nr:hypothetical protein Zmor_009527 [Zophobas morio]